MNKNRFNKSRHNIMQKIITCSFAVIIPAGFITSCGVTDTMNQRTETCTVTGKESVIVGHGEDKHNQYRVYTEDCGTLSVQDTIVGFRYNSADIYGKIKEGETYEFDLGGYRQGVLNMFPNILDMKKV